MTQTQRLPLHEFHARLGAKFMEFAGWEVPLQYSTIVEEHHAVRKAAGVFDVSHMGKFVIRGKGAYSFLESVLSNGLKKITDGRALYSLLLNDKGGVVDDVIVYQISQTHFFMIVNAATREKDFRWLEAHKPENAELIDQSAAKTIVAVQGPASEALLSKVFHFDFKLLRPFHFRTLDFAGEAMFVGATGYTGERGFEIVGLKENTPSVFEKIFEIGKEFGLRPAGFGARDTLRLEAKYLLYGQDMDDETTPLEAGLEWVLDFSKDFIGREALKKQMNAGLTRKLASFEITGGGVARHGYEIVSGGRTVGSVTSGTFSPTLQKSIGLAYLPLALGVPGQEFDVKIRERLVKAKAVKPPFYKSGSLL